MVKPVLYSLIGVDREITSIHLFFKFLLHYKCNLGIETIILDLQSERNSLRRMAKFRLIAKQFGARIRHEVFSSYSSAGLQLNLLQEFAKEYASPSRWCIIPDCDELVYFKGSFQNFLSHQSSRGVNVIVGTLKDRLNLSSFPRIRDKPLDVLFPYSYPLTRIIREGCDRKVVAFKGSFLPLEGKHYLREERELFKKRAEYQHNRNCDSLRTPIVRETVRKAYPLIEAASPGIRRWKGRVSVHHFGWNKLMLKKAKQRLSEPDLTHRRELEKIIRFYSSGERIVESLPKPWLLRKNNEYLMV